MEKERKVRSFDNRDKDEVIRYLEAEVEVLKGRIAEQYLTIRLYQDAIGFAELEVLPS